VITSAAATSRAGSGSVPEGTIRLSISPSPASSNPARRKGVLGARLSTKPGLFLYFGANPVAAEAALVYRRGDASHAKLRQARLMRITDIRETAVPLNSTLANSSIDFSEMTTSVAAVITDVKPVCGFAFNSTGRYACGAQLRARFIPRVLKADPKSLLDEAGDNFAPEKILAERIKTEAGAGTR